MTDTTPTPPDMPELKTRKNDIRWRLENWSDRTGSCWNWKGYKNRRGYGRLRYKGKKHLAHRVAYEVYVGAFDSNFLVCHSCDNPSCINPEHLFLGTSKDNIGDCVRKGRHKGISNSPFVKGNQYARKH